MDSNKTPRQVIITDPRLAATWPNPCTIEQGIPEYELRAMLAQPLALFPGQACLIRLGYRFAQADIPPGRILHVPFSGESSRTALLLGSLIMPLPPFVPGAGDDMALSIAVHPVAKAPIVIQPCQRLGRVVVVAESGTTG